MVFGILMPPFAELLACPRTEILLVASQSRRQPTGGFDLLKNESDTQTTRTGQMHSYEPVPEVERLA